MGESAGWIQQQPLGMVFKTPAMRVRVQNGGWHACLARRVPGGTRKPTGASDARFEHYPLNSPFAIKASTSCAPPTSTPFTNTMGKVAQPVHSLSALRRRSPLARSRHGLWPHAREWLGAIDLRSGWGVAWAEILKVWRKPEADHLTLRQLRVHAARPPPCPANAAAKPGQTDRSRS